MFDRFTENAKKTLQLSRDAAMRHRADCIGTEHILIALLELPASSARSLLLNQSIDIDSLRSALDTLLPRGTSDRTTLPFTPAAKRVLERSLHEAAQLGHTYIGSQHLLLSIMRAGDNDAASVLTRVGVTAQALHQDMTDSIPMNKRARARLLLISNSTMHGGGYLEHCRSNIAKFLGKRSRVTFVPFALADHDGYAEKARESFAAMGHDLVSAHTFTDKLKALDEADAVFVGGGNTFRLLSALHHYGLLQAIQERVFAGMAYIGSSAGTNVATLSIRTTNDMPIVQPPSFTALQLVPFQINPHYLDPNPDSSHMGETRQERIMQFHEECDEPVLGLREGCMLQIEGEQMQLLGTTNARLFRRGQDPEEFEPPCDLSFLLKD